MTDHYLPRLHSKKASEKVCKPRCLSSYLMVNLSIEWLDSITGQHIPQRWSDMLHFMVCQQRVGCNEENLTRCILLRHTRPMEISFACVCVCFKMRRNATGSKQRKGSVALSLFQFYACTCTWVSKWLLKWNFIRTTHKRNQNTTPRVRASN